MQLRSRTTALVLATLITTFAFAPQFQNSLPAATTQLQQSVTGNSPAQQLTKSLELAKSGDIPGALLTARQANQNFQSLRLFTVNYLDTLLTILEMEGKANDVELINEAITTVNTLRKSGQYNGDRDPEMAFLLMKSLGRLSIDAMEFNDRISSKIRILEGKIAMNLQKNPAYPKDALEALAGPLVSMAQGHAIRQDEGAAFAALRSAVDVGFGDFESLVNDEYLGRLNNAAGVEELIDDLEIQYVKAVKRWSQTVLTQFKPFKLDFDLENVDGGRVSHASFGGKVVVVDLWATWCAPCRKGIPHFIELQKKFKREGVAVLGVSMDNADNPSSALPTVRAFIEEQGFNYACAMGDKSFAATVPGQQILPTTIFMDQSGMVRYIARGYHDYAKLEAITKQLASENQMVRADFNGSN